MHIAADQLQNKKKTKSKQVKIGQQDPESEQQGLVTCVTLSVSTLTTDYLWDNSHIATSGQ